MLSESTRLQIEKVEVESERPLVICDVDEVVVHFIRGLEGFLERNDMWLHPQSFALNGNIKRKHDDEPVPANQLGDVLNRFFDEEIHRLEVIEGAASSLNTLSEHASVIMLTNLPGQFHDRRVDNLKLHGLEFPVISNKGPKGPAVKELLRNHRAESVFVDDIPNYLQSVSEHCPEVHLVHFMQDIRFGRHVGELNNVSLRADNWSTVHTHISSLLQGQ